MTPPDSRSVLPPYTVGLTGGIASGKSTVARAFHALGVCIIDADQISRDLTAPGQPLLAAMVAEWGDAILSENGTLNRGHLRSIIFADPEARARLNAMSHPLIRAEMFARARACADPNVILEIPLLVEGGLQNQVDRVLVVECPATPACSRKSAAATTDAACASCAGLTWSPAPSRPTVTSPLSSPAAPELAPWRPCFPAPPAAPRLNGHPNRNGDRSAPNAANFWT